LGRHSKCGAESCNSIWRPRWPPHPYTQYNSIGICLGVIHLVSLPRFWGSRNPMKSFSGLKKVAGIGEFQDGRQNGRRALSDSLSRFIIELVLGLRGVPCAMICPLILTSDPCRGPIKKFKKNLGRHSKCGAERCNSIWRPRRPPHPYTQYNSIGICLGVINFVSLPRF